MAENLTIIKQRLFDFTDVCLVHLLKLYYFREYNQYLHGWASTVYRCYSSVYKDKKTNKWPKEDFIYTTLWENRIDAYKEHHGSYVESFPEEFKDLPKIEKPDEEGSANFCSSYFKWLAHNLSKKGSVTLEEVKENITNLLNQNKLQESTIELKPIRENRGIVLREMATRWRPSDEGGKWPMWIKIGSGVHSSDQSEHGVPHAHFITEDRREKGVFSIQNEIPPKDFKEITVIEGTISSEWKKILVEWANLKSKSYPEYTNWYVARDDWNVN